MLILIVTHSHRRCDAMPTHTRLRVCLKGFDSKPTKSKSLNQLDTALLRLHQEPKSFEPSTPNGYKKYKPEAPPFHPLQFIAIVMFSLIILLAVCTAKNASHEHELAYCFNALLCSLLLNACYFCLVEDIRIRSSGMFYSPRIICKQFLEKKELKLKTPNTTDLYSVKTMSRTQEHTSQTWTLRVENQTSFQFFLL
jgi:hypothetical protein